MPVMLLCRVQLNLYWPGWVGAVKVADWPCDRSSVLKLVPSSADTLWAAPSWLVTLTVTPGLTVSGAPNWKSLMMISAAAAPPPPPPPPAVVLAGGGLSDEPLPEEQAATVRAASSAATARRRSLIMLGYT